MPPGMRRLAVDRLCNTAQKKKCNEKNTEGERESPTLWLKFLKLIIASLEGSGFHHVLKMGFWREESLP